MKRRLDLASALGHEPEVLFLDEPTTGLDPASRLTVWDEVRRINGRGTTVFLTTQYLEEATSCAIGSRSSMPGRSSGRERRLRSRTSCAGVWCAGGAHARRRVHGRHRPCP
jgi:ABC-type molybdenum transport system ATPase subunit/photorepair protein PhrA